MKPLGLRTVDLRTAKLPDLSLDVPVGLGAQPDRLTEPVFRSLAGRHHLVLGRRLVAAALRRGDTAIEAKVVTCDDGEQARMALIDAAWACQVARDLDGYYRLVGQVVDAFKDEAMLGVQDPLKYGRGRPRTTRGKAITLTSEALGVAPKTIERALAFCAGKVTKPKKLPAEFETFGLVDERAPFLAHIGTIQRKVEQARRLVAAAVGVLTELQQQPSALALCRKGTLQRAKEALVFNGGLLQDEIPASLCPWCKALDGQDGCRQCDALGWVGSQKALGAPQALRDKEKPMVSTVTGLERIET